MSIDDPVEVFLSFVRAARTTLDGTEQPGLPVDAIVGTSRRLISLTVFNLGLFIRGGGVVRRDDSFDRFLP